MRCSPASGSCAIPNRAVGIRFKVFVAKLHGFDTSYAWKIKATVEDSYARQLLKLLLIF
jgi:hypothetical protein